MNESGLDKFLSNFSDYHIPVAVFIFVAGSAIQWFHKLDAGYIAFTSTILTFLGTHSIFAPRGDNPEPEKKE